MKNITLITLSLLIAGFAFSRDKDEAQKNLVIGRILPKPDDKPTGDKKPVRPVRKPFPKHWGKPPAIQTKDIRPLPHGFGMGSSTLAKWITINIKNDLENKKPERRPRPDPSEEMKKKINAVRLAQNDLSIARKTLHQNLKDKSKEEIGELIREFKEAQKAKHQELKEAKQELAREVRERIQTGDHRE